MPTPEPASAASAPNPPSMGGHWLHLHPGVVYTAGRLACFLAVGGLLYLIGFRSWLLVLVALLLSAPLSLVLLRGPRQAFAERIAGRTAARKVEKERLRAVLRGDDV